MADTLDGTEFETRSEADWRGLAEQALGGAPFESLVSETDDGIAYGPIHARVSPAVPILRSEPATPWRIVQRVDDPDPVRANLQALADLEGGANALALVFEGAPSAGGFGLPLTKRAILSALDGVMLEMVHVRIEPHPDLDTAVMLLRQAVVARRGVGFDRLSVDQAIDPIGCFAATGRFPGRDDQSLRYRLEDLLKPWFDEGLGGTLVEADGRVYHEAGASEAQELGAVLSTALYYLRAFSGSGHDLHALILPIAFTLVADQKQFLATAKVRALRLLWSRLLAECEVNDARHAIRIHVETSRRMMTAKDPHTNIVRTTIAAFAAATGGADSLSVLPFTAANGLPEAKARRLARNVQAILQDESGLSRVADPAAGSGGIEALTEAIAEAAWDEFRRIEAEGGIAESLQKGALQARIGATRAARQARFDDRSEAAIGVTHYPMETEREIAVLVPAAEGAATIADGSDCEPLRPRRLTETREHAA
ncbi:MAG: methylmalonyl-CoA mutase [Rhizobiaceae bacterium]|nr:methylmalonyl-CoA mutase [Rhizobiaceae bacterium]